MHPLLQPRFAAAAAAAGTQPSMGPLSFTGWLYRGVHHPPPLPLGYPLGRGHELMRRLCTMNPAFAQSIIEDYIRPTVRFIPTLLSIIYLLISIGTYLPK